jgi:hypothetical protein
VFQDLANDTVLVEIVDPLDRTHPYVQWKRTRRVPNTVNYFWGQNEVSGYWLTERRSTIHRTALPGRCKFATRYSPKAALQYSDALPFPVEQLAAHRKKVCEYCFFGGPDKTQPIF